MREKYEQELRVAQMRGVLSQEEAEALITEGLLQGCHPLELLVARGILSEETLDEIRAAAYGTGAPLHAGLKQGETLSFRRPPAEPPARVEEPLTPGSPTRTIQPGTPPAVPPAKPPVPADAPVTPGSPTLTVHPTPSQTTPYPQEPAFPVPGWERYQPVRFLGQGGMGRVYLAYDPVLRRNVALKFVRGDDPELQHRFISEAQAQARVEHERVCKVYEVGEVQGQPFIAMQYVEGCSLLDLIRELSLEQKVMVMQQVTEGVHAAHRAGLIHRDIKPTNILVERGEDGRWKPYVMDFGLARDWQREATVTGTVLGTPHYMAPEQARGEVSQLDRRADVYSLGATLYVMLTGKTPIPGTNALEVLTNLATQEARPLREHNKNVPVDLEAIVLKCLEREPSARYDSARALAEDLGRFLNGEPVQARAVGTWYRLRKKARKHWALVSVASVALVLVLLALGKAELTRRDSAERERLSSHFTKVAGDVEARARFIALSRLHDTRAERQELRTRLGEIERAMGESGEVAQGPGHYALGQGWLDLGDPAKAREHLEAAKAAGYEDPQANVALALAMSQLYNEQLLSLGQLASELRKARREELAVQYREPALNLLRESKNAQVNSSEYMKALLAFYEEHYDEALGQLNSLGERMPWFYEAPKLRGDILHVRALMRWSDGQQTEKEKEQVQADLEEARRSYLRAADTAQSAPEVHCGLARVEWAAVSMALYSNGEVAPHIERALQHLSRALQAAPDHAASWVLQATLYRNLAQSSHLQGQAAEKPLRQAIDSAQKALDLNPSNMEARKELGMDWLELATLHQKINQDPREPLQHALKVFKEFETTQSDYYVYHGLGLIFTKQADYAESLGADSLLHRNEAIKAFQKSVELKDNYEAGWVNLATQYYKRATLPKAPSPKEDLEQAWQALQKSRELDRQNFLVRFQAGRVQLAQAQRLRDSGEDERPALTAALDACREGLAINPRMVELHNLKGLAHKEQARAAWERGEDPLPLMDQAQQAFDQARTLAPQRNWAYNNLADLSATRAMYLSSRGQDARPSARAALQLAREAQQRAPTHYAPLIDMGHASQLLAAFALEDGADPRPYLIDALETLQQALERSPDNTETWLYLAEARAVQAQWSARQGRGADKDFEKAHKAYQQAILSTERPLDYRLAFGRFCHTWATWRKQAGLDASVPLEQGLSLVSEVLKARPDWAEALALRASLEGLRPQSQPDAAP
ncbi:serine/threonine-protein kinase [Hyalangium minutum]|uniref:Protein kinase domain-containing protein n=1 Tax=Hyalangium minutum TaxID=394096 RepID=A0A085W2L7_9BACT|nr:serine/threonine-protein kinase [Hyalangium minutum]KFE61930.1 hypothetical protein DB31_4373 [Hyalangium minutum]